MILEDDRIKFAIPSKGRLKEPTIELLKKAGYKFRANGRHLYATCTNANITFIFVRADDIPVLVNKGVCDLGITGSDLVIERKTDVETLINLGYGKCKLSIAIQEKFNPQSLKDFTNKTIATSFPVITKKFFEQQNVEINTIEMNGSVEIMIALQLADAIVDLVETGDTLRENKLKVYTDLDSYECVLIKNKNISTDNIQIEKIKRRIEGILIAQQYSILEYNIKKEKLAEAEKIAPGYNSPTLAALEKEDWTAVKVMIKKSDVINIMEKLEILGAEAIMETEVTNCRL